MNQEKLQNKLIEMKESGFMKPDEYSQVYSKIKEFIDSVGDLFGYNDGEPLDEDGIKFVLEVVELKWKLTNGIYDEDEK